MPLAIAVHAALLFAFPWAFLRLAGYPALALVQPASLTVAVILLGWSNLEASAARYPDRVRPFEPGARLALASGAGILALGWVALLEGSTRPEMPAPLVLLALGLGTTGALLRWRAIRELGDRFTSSLVPAGPQVRTGVYRWLRHPSEVGLLLLLAALVLVARSVWAATLGLSLAGLSVWRVRMEDRLLPSPSSPPLGDATEAATHGRGERDARDS